MEGALCFTPGRGRVNPADASTCDAKACGSFHIGSPAEITMLKQGVDTTCASDAESDWGGVTCGLVLNPTDRITFTQVSGTLAGYWTQNAICAADPNTNGCTGDAVSDNADTHCCGCVDWQNVLSPGAVPRPCKNNNPLWDTKIQPTLEWLRRVLLMHMLIPSVLETSQEVLAAHTTILCRRQVVFCDTHGGWNTEKYMVELCPGDVYWDV
ncbi:hypothetical protein EXIGLDRAFT_833033 [Exidia glandulosa HHB12029]|uniref:Uncharacterized protein n=1 Tax=Exidia glandulosa HHB12029 TaxID=1314781 RepID=A0A166B1Y0_EXIGL|nr:hypothetical protein EXIGLDRAFT_833033 [Exidia glandulosa HHB12029]